MKFLRILTLTFFGMIPYGYAQEKFIPLLNNRNLLASVGGELRVQHHFFINENWGDIPDDKNGFLLNRALLHVDTKYKNRIRLFAQLQSSTAFSKMESSTIDKNVLDIHQLFTDFNLVSGKHQLSFRFGRQEMFYGSQRIISVREGPNSRQSFDAIKMIHHYKNYKTDIFYSQHVRNNYGVFNDAISRNSKLYGLYTVINNLAVLQHMDVYYLGLNKRDATYNNITGQEHRHSIGWRFWSNNVAWNYDVEAVYQFGHIAHQSIRAWTTSINSTYSIHSSKLKPKFGLKTEFISGDRSSTDQKLGTFNPLFPRGAYFGLAALIGPSNLIDIHPSVELKLKDQLVVSADYDVFWRFSKKDGVYQPNTALLYAASDSPHSFIGKQLGITLDYDVTKRFSLKLEATWFQPGSYIKDVSSGKDIFFTATSITYQY